MVNNYKSDLVNFLDDWPTGYYSLPRPKSGCQKTAGKTWDEGWIEQDLEDDKTQSSKLSPNFHMDAILADSSQVSLRRTFCSKRNDAGRYIRWPKGKLIL